MDAQAFAELLPRFLTGFRLHPLWPREELLWLLDQAAKKRANGPLSLVALCKPHGMPIGCYALHGEAPGDWRDAVFFEHDFRTVKTQAAETALGISSDECSYAVIRDGRYKYVHFAALPPLLFDMVEDPHETRNLADRPEMAATVLHYAQRMLNWRLSHAERTLTNMQLTKDGVFSRP